MTNSTNENESAVAEAKLEEQLLKRGITKDQLEKRVEEGIEDPTLKEAIKQYEKDHDVKLKSMVN